jgi:hypothetical protein
MLEVRALAQATNVLRQAQDIRGGSCARFSDFAGDVRKAVEADGLPEYALSVHANGEGEEVVHFLPRSSLPATDPRFEAVRFPGRRLTTGIRSGDREGERSEGHTSRHGLLGAS